MALIRPVRGITPKIAEDVFLADNATVVGDVVIGKGCSIWFNAVLRGDVNSIRIGEHTNIQDGSVLHTLYQKSTINIGNHVSIGHNVTIHGADVKDGALIGMGATVLDHAVVGEGAIVAALIIKNTPKKEERKQLIAKLKLDKKNQIKELNQKIANNYAMYASWYTDEEKK